MNEHESREALRERIAAEVWIGSAYPDERDDPLSRRIWHDMPPTDLSARRAYATADRILALLPVAPVVGEREAEHQRAIRGFDDDGEPVCICGLTFWSDDVCVDCGDTENAAYSRMARRRALAARTPEEEPRD